MTPKPVMDIFSKHETLQDLIAMLKYLLLNK